MGFWVAQSLPAAITALFLTKALSDEGQQPSNCTTPPRAELPKILLLRYAYRVFSRRSENGRSEFGRYRASRFELVNRVGSSARRHRNAGDLLPVSRRRR